MKFKTAQILFLSISLLILTFLFVMSVANKRSNVVVEKGIDQSKEIHKNTERKKSSLERNTKEDLSGFNLKNGKRDTNDKEFANNRSEVGFLVAYKEMKKKVVMTNLESEKYRNLVNNSKNHDKAFLLLKKAPSGDPRKRLLILNYLLECLRSCEGFMKDDLSEKLLDFLHWKNGFKSLDEKKFLAADKIEIIHALDAYNSDLVKNLRDENEYFSRLVHFAENYGVLQ